MITDMTKGSPLRHILLFSVPLLIGNIFQQLYNIADLVIVGRTLGVEAFAAVGAVAPLFFLITFVIVGLTNGFAVITGQRYGAKDIDGVRNSAIISTILSVIVTIVFSLVCCILMKPILYWMNVPQNIYHNAYWYVQIIIIGLIATTLYNLLASIIRALGDSKNSVIFFNYCIINQYRTCACIYQKFSHGSSRIGDCRNPFTRNFIFTLLNFH